MAKKNALNKGDQAKTIIRDPKTGKFLKTGGRMEGSKNKATLFKELIFSIALDRQDEIKQMAIKDISAIAKDLTPRETKLDMKVSEPLSININYNYDPKKTK